MKNLTQKNILSILFFLTLIIPGVALASGQHTLVGTISNYYVAEHPNGSYLIVTLNADAISYGTTPACAVKPTRFAISTDSPIIDQVTSIVMTAHLSGLKVAMKSPQAWEAQQCHGFNQRLALVNVKAL